MVSSKSSAAASAGRDRRARRSALLRELAEARALRERVAPRRTRMTRARLSLHLRSYRL